MPNTVRAHTGTLPFRDATETTADECLTALPPGAVEGTHQHIGSEELYYFIEGEGVAYLGDGDDPMVDKAYPLVEPMPDIYGLGPKPCRQVPVRPGITLFTKSGGIHGVRNPAGNTGPLKFVAFGYHSS
jgi:mannose-6-phosphate isomerase-like protein (cupin superfamily)